MENVQALPMSRNIFLERYAWKDRIFPDYKAPEKLNQIIVIPAFKETELSKALDSINQCDAPQGKVLILVIINESENADSETLRINQACHSMVSDYHSGYGLLCARIKLPEKKAGVGLARKIGMDEAVRIFEDIRKDGSIVCYDADCYCQKNYLTEIEKAFSDSSIKAGIVFYEHRLHQTNHEAILNYELYLRYYIDGLRFSGYPHAHQTLGSCIVVRSSYYQSQGGMNTRKAGEDFYFLNKVIPHGEFVEINSTTVYPSDRISDRVPFGTGKAVSRLLESSGAYEVYNPKSFEDLKLLFSQAGNFWNQSEIQIPESIDAFMNGETEREVNSLRKQTSTEEAFYKRFFGWFDAFKILKFIHFARDQYYPNVPLDDTLDWLEKNYTGQLPEDMTEKLIELRSFDRKWIK